MVLFVNYLNKAVKKTPKKLTKKPQHTRIWGIQHDPNIKIREKHYKKGKLQTTISHDCRHKYPQQFISKLNLVIRKTDNASQIEFIPQIKASTIFDNQSMNLPY